ncbi:MAG: S9 family peptidase [Fimbriimonadales bacterium]|nr:S9 family peptidase [Fimbriimonadales bacterium]
MTKRAITPEDLLRFQLVGDPWIHPDGERVLFTLKRTREKYKVESQLWMASLHEAPRQITTHEGGAGHGRFSPDGRRIAFLSKRGDACPQIHLLSLEGGEAQRLTDFPEGTVSEFQWSPCGGWLLARFREAHPDWTEEARKRRQEQGQSDAPWVIETPLYRLDGDGIFGGQRFRLHVVNAQTGERRLAYSCDRAGVGPFVWTADASGFFVARPRSDEPWRGPEDDVVLRVDLDGNVETLDRLPPGPKEALAASPDGRWLAWLGDDRVLATWGARNRRLFVHDLHTGETRCLSAGTDACLLTATLADAKEGASGVLVWSPDSRALYVNLALHGQNHIGCATLETDAVVPLTFGQRLVQFGNVSADGTRFGVVFGGAARLQEVGLFDLDRHDEGPIRLTGFNDGLFEELEVAEPKEHWIDTPDGSRVHVWSLLPARAKEGERLPVVLEIHGGPHCQYGWTFFHEFQVLAAQGYAVVYSNPRGSKGYGEAHCRAIEGDWGNKDWVDIQAVRDWIRQQPWADSSRMGVMGGSYGGYMTNWVVSHCDDFVAAITDRCVSNLVSFGGNSDFPHLEDGYWKGAPWSDITELWRQSPIAHFAHVRTPMLILHSEGDLRCNIEQSEQVFVALVQRGVRARFVRYPRNTSHGMSRNGPPDLRIHRLNEILRWWAEHLGPPPKA